MTSKEFLDYVLKANLLNDKVFADVVYLTEDRYGTAKLMSDLCASAGTIRRWAKGITVPVPQIRETIRRCVVRHTIVEIVQNYCDEHDIKFLVVDAPHVQMDDVAVNGYFSSTDKTLAIAIGKNVLEWVPVLLHEFCHAQQFVENPVSFTANDTDDFFGWVSGKIDLSQEEVSKQALGALWLEGDCEARTLVLIKEMGLEAIVEPKRYAQKANAYITFYKYMLENRCWYSPGCEPYALDEVWSSFPEEIFSWGCELTDDIRKLFKKCVISKTEMLADVFGKDYKPTEAQKEDVRKEWK